LQIWECEDLTYSRAAEAYQADEDDLGPWMRIECHELWALLLLIGNAMLGIVGCGGRGLVLIFFVCHLVR
jgi:hypothetical protein